MSGKTNQVATRPTLLLQTLLQLFHSIFAMSSLPNGDYVIYSRVLSYTGQKLALTSNGVNQYAAVQPLASPAAQTQVVSGTNRSQIAAKADISAPSCC